MDHAAVPEQGAVGLEDMDGKGIVAEGIGGAVGATVVGQKDLDAYRMPLLPEGRCHGIQTGKGLRAAVVNGQEYGNPLHAFLSGKMNFSSRSQRRCGRCSTIADNQLYGDSSLRHERAGSSFLLCRIFWR